MDGNTHPLARATKPPRTNKRVSGSLYAQMRLTFTLGPAEAVSSFFASFFTVFFASEPLFSVLFASVTPAMACCSAATSAADAERLPPSGESRAEEAFLEPPVEPPVDPTLFAPLPELLTDAGGDVGGDVNVNDVNDVNDDEYDALARGDANLLACLKKKITNSGVPYKELKKGEFETRARAYRERAKAIFECELLRQVRHHANDQQADYLRAALHNELGFDNGSTRRGACKSRSVGRGKAKVVQIGSIKVSFSGRLIDFGCPAKEVLLLARHELSHAANPGQHHNAAWRIYDLLVGGDGKRCDGSDVTRSTLGHKVEVYCESIHYGNNANAAEPKGRHFFQKRQNRPSMADLRRCCIECRKEGKTGKLFYRRRSLASTAVIQ